MLDAYRSRPAGAASETAGRLSENHSNQLTDAALLARRHEYGLYVLAERADGRVCGQVFTSLPAAERKVARVRVAGRLATMTLVRLVPTTTALSDALPGLDDPQGVAR